MIWLVIACMKAALLQAILVPALMMFLVNEAFQHVSSEYMPVNISCMTWVHYLKSELMAQSKGIWTEIKSWRVRGHKSRWRHHGPRLFPRKKINIARMLCKINMAYLAMTAEALQANNARPTQVTFDSDAFTLYVDNGATTSISHRIEDFEGPVKPID